MTNKERVLVQMLIAVRATLDAAIDHLTGEGEAAPCQHPVNRRQDFSTMEKECWNCLECGHSHLSQRD